MAIIVDKFEWLPQYNTPAEKVVFPTQTFPDDVETKDSDIQPHD